MVNTIPGEAHAGQQVALYCVPLLEKEQVDLAAQFNASNSGI